MPYACERWIVVRDQTSTYIQHDTIVTIGRSPHVQNLIRNSVQWIHGLETITFIADSTMAALVASLPRRIRYVAVIFRFVRARSHVGSHHTKLWHHVPFDGGVRVWRLREFVPSTTAPIELRTLRRVSEICVHYSIDLWIIIIRIFTKFGHKPNEGEDGRRYVEFSVGCQPWHEIHQEKHTDFTCASNNNVMCNKQYFSSCIVFCLTAILPLYVLLLVHSAKNYYHPIYIDDLGPWSFLKKQ